ncbi:TPA: hypothetical protein N0F65_001646, partial [Lagenidium giganteum]
LSGSGVPVSNHAVFAMHKRVKVSIRVRPNDRNSSVVVNETERTISVVTNAAQRTGTCFHFDQVLGPEVNQSGVYSATAAETVESVLSGYNGTIMAYGQTGAGKTFTMSGGKRNFDDRGICPRSISAIFQHIHRDADHSYVVRVSYVEVYNENLYDLLTDMHDAQPNAREDLVIQDNDKGQTFIRGLTRALVKSEEDAFDLLFQGETNRTIAEHSLNASSTRSHCIFTVYIEKSPAAHVGGDDGGSSEQTVFSKLNLVDLAGSERMKKTHVSGAMLKEAAHINKSLTFLEQVVVALGDKKRQHIPYRQTTLTNLLKDSLGGNCRTLLIACVWPEDTHNDQSLATLKFATRMMRVKTSAIINIAQPAGGGGGVNPQVLDKYVQEIKRLKMELALHDVISGRNNVDYDHALITSSARQDMYRSQVKAFVADPGANPLVLQSATQIQQLFVAFRDVCLEGQQAAQTMAPPAPTVSDSKMVRSLRNLRAVSPSYEVSGAPRSLSKSPGATTTLPPINPSSMPETPEDEEPQTVTANAAWHLPALPHQQQPQVPVLSEKELFEAFKNQQNPKPESLLDLDVAKHNLRQAKKQASDFGLDVNRLKLEIDGLTLKVEDLKQREDRDDAGKEIELALLQLKDTKRLYRDKLDHFREKKAEMLYLTKIKEQMLQHVTREFDEWKRTRSLTSSLATS